MVRVESIGNSIVGGLTPGIGLPQHDIVGWTKTTALRRLISSRYRRERRIAKELAGVARQ